MSKVLAAVFGVILCGVAVGLDFHLQTQRHEGQDYGFMDYVSERSAGVSQKFALGGGQGTDDAETPAVGLTKTEPALPVKAMPSVVSLAKGGTAPAPKNGTCVRRAGKLVCPES